MIPIDKKILEYAEKVSAQEDDLINRLVRETHLRTLSPQMLCGSTTANFLHFVCKLLRPKRILEIGTYTGYSTIFMARAVEDDAQVITLESDVEVLDIAKKYFKESGVDTKIVTHQGDAIELIPSLEGPFDLVFVDASKTQYSTYYDLFFQKIRSGGVILVDNVLWYGEVVQEKMKPKAKAIVSFNNKISLDDRVFNVLMPFGDGVNCIVKR